MAKLEVQNVHIEYLIKRTGQRIMAVGGVSFAVQGGQFVTIVGPSGCGKTTLLNAIDGLVPVKSGRILLDGQEIRGPGHERAMVFQSPALMPWRTVMRNVTYGLELRGSDPAEARATAQRFIDVVGLHGFEESFPRELSGGMQQRANLARALTAGPELLLLDEPLAALDAQTREYMQFELQRIWWETRKTAVYVTHQISEAIYLGDQVIVVSARPGRVKEVVPVDLPRPRSLRVKRQPGFIELEEHIWNLIQEEAAKTGMLVHEEERVEVRSWQT
ncbi:MAG TPA: ABC transporter ATP-binding protein [Anaerolineae bacterium]|nr:ABC transporter ATP-binding protein [Anaerolineae bacterium]